MKKTTFRAFVGVTNLSLCAVHLLHNRKRDGSGTVPRGY